MKDSTGKWNTASTGTYEINANDYIETHWYSTEQNWIGSTYWQKYEIKSDTLYFKLFTKVTNSEGEDVTTQYPDRRKKSKSKEIRVTDFPQRWIVSQVKIQISLT